MQRPIYRPATSQRHFATTSSFYGALGFVESWRDKSWMILKRGDLVLEFFPYPDLDPLTSAFGSCLRLDDLDGFYAICKAQGLAETSQGQPRLHPPKLESSGLRIGALIDLDGTLLRLIENT